jgi:hypothetical protein
MSEANAEVNTISSKTLYDQIVPPGTKTKTEDYKAFTYKQPEVFEEQLRNKIFFIGQNHMQGVSLADKHDDDDRVDMSLKKQASSQKSKN